MTTRSWLRSELLALVATTALVTGARVHAITFGFVDTTGAFRNTGAFIVKAPDGRIFPICSGTLIAPTVFLTASHCTVFFEQDLAPDGYTAFVSFDSPIPFGDLTSASTKLVTVTDVVSNPLFNQAQSDSQDIAVLLVDSRGTRGITPAVLPAAGLLDQLRAQNGLKTAIFTAAGYGLQNRVTGGGQPFFQDANPVPRMFAFSGFNSLNGGYLRLSQNPSTGNGGTCFGDSGGPNFLNVNGVRTLVAITITGDSVCRSTNVDYRPRHRRRRARSSRRSSHCRSATRQRHQAREPRKSQIEFVVLRIFVVFVPELHAAAYEAVSPGFSTSTSIAPRLDQRLQLVGRAGQRRERAVVHRHHLAHAEQLARLRRRRRIHRVVIADRQERDLRRVELADQPHVAEERRVAGEVDRAAVFQADHEARGEPDVVRPCRPLRCCSCGRAGVIEIFSPLTSTVPPTPMPMTSFSPCPGSQFASSNTATTGAPVARATATTSPE